MLIPGGKEVLREAPGLGLLGCRLVPDGLR